jgi:hypothetical protein
MRYKDFQIARVPRTGRAPRNGRPAAARETNTAARATAVPGTMGDAREVDDV